MTTPPHTITDAQIRQLADRAIAQQAAPPQERATMTTITISQIEALRREAAAAGDQKQVATCDRALNGSQRARRVCARVIAGR